MMFARISSAIFLTLLSGCVFIDQLRSKRTNSIPDAISEGPAPEDLSCRVECAVGQETEKCARLNLTVTRPEYLTRVEKIPFLFAAAGIGGQIPTQSFMDLFDDPTDTHCGRTAVDVGEGYKFSNLAATDCEEQFTTQNGGATVYLQLPREIRGQFVFEQEGFSILFPEKDARPVIKFDELFLSLSRGGPITEVSYFDMRVTAAAARICYMARLSDG